MIVNEKLGDALDATEPFLLVPAPVGIAKGFSDSFLGQVIQAFPETGERLVDIGGVRGGCVELIDPTGDGKSDWMPGYTLALAGIHYREPNGWNEAADMLRIAIEKLRREAPSPDIKLATAGIPGSTGISGKAMSGVEYVLRNHPMDVVVYRRNGTHRSPRTAAAIKAVQNAPAARMPGSSAERHPEFSSKD